MAPSTSNQQVSFSSQLMQNYRLAKSVSAGTQIAAAASDGNPTAVFSISTQGRVCYIFADADSDTGWNITDLQFPGTAVYLAAAFEAGQFSVFAADASNNVYNITGPSWPASWTQLPVQLPTGVSVANLQCAGELLFIKDSTATVWAPEYTFPPGVYVWTQFQGGPSTPVIDWSAAVITAYGQNTLNLPGAFAIWNNSGTTQISTSVMDTDSWQVSAVAQQAVGPYTKVAAANSPQGSPNLFAVNGTDSGLYYLYGASATVSNYTALKISGDIAVSAVKAGSDDKGNLEVFALSTDSTLYHARQTSKGATSWSDFLPLNESLKLAQLVVSHNAAGYSDVFAVTTDDELYHIWQEPLSDEWHFDKIKTAQVGAPVEEYNTYTVQLTVFDNTYVLAPNAAVQVSSDRPVIVEINNQTIFLDTNNPWQGVSNAAGQVTLTLKTGTLGVPQLSVSTSLMPAGDSIVVDASGPIAARLADIDDQGQVLLQARVDHSDGTQTPLLDAKYRNDSQLVADISKAVQNMTALAVNQPNAGSADSPFLHERNDARVARHKRAGTAGVATDGATPERHFQVDFSTDRPVVFRALTAEEAQQLIAAGEGLPQALKFFGRDVDWGDVFDVIKDGIAKVAEFVVSTITNGVKFSVHFVIDNVKYAWNAVLEYGASFAEKAFDLVQEVFEKVKVSFEHLFGWLAYIFNWADILRTHQVLHYTIDQMFEIIEEAIEDFKKAGDSALASAETWISQKFSSAIANFAGGDSLGQYQAANNAPNPQAAGLTSTNVLFTGLLNNANSIQIAGGGPAAVPLTGDASQKLEELMQKVGVYISGLQSTAAFTQAVTFFQQVGSSPDNGFGMVISGLLSLVEALALVAIEGLTVVFNLLCDAAKHIVHLIREVLKAEWQIPYVSDLYAHITQDSKLSGLDLMSLVFAIPATVFYKLVYDESPFPAQTDVVTFEQNFTAANILSAWGIGSAGEATTSDAITVSDTWTKFFAAAYSANMFYFGIMEAVVDVQPVEGSTLPSGFSWATYGCEVALLGTSLPPLNQLSFGISGATWQATQSFMWWYQVLGSLIDGICLVSTGKFPRNANDLGVTVDTIYGVFDGLIIFYRSLLGNISAAQIVQNVMGVVPEISKFLRYSDVIEVTKGVSLPVLGAIDFAMDETVCYINLFTIKS